MGLLTDLVLPPQCVVCERREQGVWCGDCLLALSRLALPPEPDELTPGVKAIGAYAYAGVVRDALLAVKTRARHDAVEHMAALMRVRLKPPPTTANLAWTWVPTSRRSLRQRVVDVPRRFAGPGAVRLLRLVREVPDQTSLGAAERLTSPRGAYRAIGDVPAAVVLFDDIRTTGGTALAAAQALRSAGARRILVVTFAVAGNEVLTKVASAD